MQLKNRPGTSLLELILVMTVIVILTGAALFGTRGGLQTLALNNTNGQLVFMIQQARSLAQSGIGSPEVGAYGVSLQSGAGRTVLFFEDKEPFDKRPASPPDTMRELLHLSDQGFSLSVKDETGRPCTNYATVLFKNTTDKVELYCDSLDDSVNQLLFSLNSTARPTTVRTFSIHRAAGVVQQ